MPAPCPTGPDFLCIGTIKGGTTWLYARLSGNPGIWLPPIKEIRYFNTIHIPGPHQLTDVTHRAEQLVAHRARLAALKQPLAPWRASHPACIAAMLEGPQDDAWYARIFGFAGPDRIRGDVTPQYALLPEAGIRHALALNPRLKAIALLRDPAQRALSHIAMRLGRDATAEGVMRVVDGPQWPGYALHSDYATWLTRWRDALPTGALHVDTLGRIEREPVAVLEDISAFLGAPAPPGCFARAESRVNAGAADRDSLLPALPHLRARLAGEYAALEAGCPDLAARFAAEGI